MQQHIGRRQPASGTTKVHMTYEIKYVAAFPFEARRETRRVTLNTVTEYQPIRRCRTVLDYWYCDQVRFLPYMY